MGIFEESQHSAVHRRGAQDMEKSQRRDDSLYPIPRRAAPVGSVGCNYRKLPDQNLPGQSRYGSRPLSAPVPFERERSRSHFDTYPQATIPYQDPGTREGREPYG